MEQFEVAIAISGIIFFIFLLLQLHYFVKVYHYRKLFESFFHRKEEYKTYDDNINDETITQLKQVGAKGSDLNTLISEINHYVVKTKGTTDFSVIQNKVERKLNMRYDQSVANLAFPTYIGLMGTFAGVFLGIFMFLNGFDGAGKITDASIQNLLAGVLVSMSTSLVGLFLTTINNAKSANSRKKIEEDKNDFFDFVQTELMPTLDAGMVSAIFRLHETVDKFEPAFNRVISNFQTTFDSCTRAFGNNFESHVRAVADAVETMGQNMDKINQNISLQQQLIESLKSKDLVKGMDRYIAAACHFERITQSLDRFSEARNMMLEAVQQAINLQNLYAESLNVPREIAVKCNQILDRIKTFEENVNRVGSSIEPRHILGNDVIEAIRKQIDQINKKDEVAMRYFETADEKLERLFAEQTALIDQLNSRYRDSLVNHIEGFEQMLKDQTDELKLRHQEFLDEMKLVVNVEEIHKDFSNLKKLNEIVDELNNISTDSVKSGDLSRTLEQIRMEISKISGSGNSGFRFGDIFGGSSTNNTEVNRLKMENNRLQNEVNTLRQDVSHLKSEIYSLSLGANPAWSVSQKHSKDSSSNASSEQQKHETDKKPEEESFFGRFSFGRRK